MNIHEMRNTDLELHMNGFHMLITAGLRKRFRKCIRLTIVGSGMVSLAMGTAILVWSLVQSGTLVPTLVCAAIAGYSALVSRRR